MDVLLVVVGSIALFWLWARYETVKTRKARRLRQPVYVNDPWKQEPQKVPARLLFQVDSRTGNRDVSMRLVRGVAESYPSKSPEWWVSKVLWDLERDRL